MLIKYLFTTLLFITIFNISCSITGDVESGNHVYSFYVSSDTTGSVVDTGSHQITETGEYELIADQPDIGYRFSYWKVVTGEENVTISDKDSVKAKVTNVKGNAAVRAVFMYSKLTLTFDGTAGGEATVSTAPVTGIQYGVATPFTATVNVNSAYAAQYEFLGQWVKVIGDITISGTTVTLKSDATIRPVLSTRKYSFTLTQPAQGGTISSSPAVGTVNYGTAIILTAAPATGWKFKNWTGGDANGKTTNPYTATLSGVTAYSAVFEKETYTLTVSAPAGGHGIISPVPGTYSYLYGATVNITATADTGWQFDSWTGATGSAATTIIMDGNKNVTATFAAIPGKSGVIYVWAGVPSGGLKDGSSWVNAYDNLTNAFTGAGIGAEIWVACGVYSPTTATSFMPKENTKIYGGCNGFEKVLSDRKFNEHFTELNGSSSSILMRFDYTGINISGCIFRNALNNGLLITKGNVVVEDCIFKDNHETALLISAGLTITRNTQIKRCVFNSNSGPASTAGKAISVGSNARTTLILNSIFINNAGPAISDNNTSRTAITSDYTSITNCTIVNNIATNDVPGGIWSRGNTRLRGCILYYNDNSSDIGTQMDSTYIVDDCDIQFHTTIQGVSKKDAMNWETSNIDISPDFNFNFSSGTLPSDRDWFVTSNILPFIPRESTLYNANFTLERPTNDIRGIARAATFDIGAYEKP